MNKLYQILKYLFLGLVQGFTEPLPISSSAHVNFFSHLFKMEYNYFTFAVFLNIASFLAILFFLIKKKHLPLLINYQINYHFILKIIIGSIPLVITSILFKKIINYLFINQIATSLSFLITSIFLFISSIIIVKSYKEQITYKDSLIIGVFQSMALIPGISRSGITLFGGITQRIKKNCLMDYSFSLYLIASLGAIILDFKNLSLLLYIRDLPLYLISFVTCFFTTYFSINWLYKVINRKTLLFFSIYTLLMSIISLIFK